MDMAVMAYQIAVRLGPSPHIKTGQESEKVNSKLNNEKGVVIPATGPPPHSPLFTISSPTEQK